MSRIVTKKSDMFANRDYSFVTNRDNEKAFNKNKKKNGVTGDS